MPNPSIQEMVALVRAAAEEAADYQERFAAEDTEARKIVDIMEHFLRAKGRVVYGGAAINAHMPSDKKFYDPRLNLPDYDFMTPDPLQDCADLIVTFQAEGFTDVEAKFGIHEGTYKIFVNFRSAADITYMPPEIYDRVVADSHSIEGIHYASPNYLRMNMYLELSRPAGMVSRWEKVYERLLLLNEAHPIKAGHCTAKPLQALGDAGGGRRRATAIHDRIVEIGIEAEAVFLSGASYLADIPPSPDEVVILMSSHRHEVARAIATAIKTPTLHFQEFPAQGELLPARTELHARTLDGTLVAVVFDTVACHSYTTLKDPAGYRLGSIDLLIQMYYAFHFAELNNLLEVRLMCVIQELVDLESERRRSAAGNGVEAAREVFPMDCIGHQPSMPELKKSHRDRVREKRKELEKALRLQESFTVRAPLQVQRRTRKAVRR